MRIAIIDLGTNTFNLLVVDILDKKNFKTVFSTKVAVKLGEGGIGKKMIAPAAFQRGVAGLRSHKAIIDKLKAQKTIAFATSAIRSAENGKKFVDIAKKETGIEIVPITGDREAELIAAGVRLALDVGTDPSLILDIGGGSNEFIIATQDTILWKQSFEMGVARLLEQFRPSDPVTGPEIAEMEAYFRKGLEPLFEAVKKHPVKELIGASGSFDTFSEMIAHRYHSISELKGRTEIRFSLEEYHQVHEALIHSTHAERQRTPGIIQLRVDMIVIASVLVSFIIRELGLDTMRMSTYSLKQGVLAELMQNY